MSNSTNPIDYTPKIIRILDRCIEPSSKLAKYIKPRKNRIQIKQISPPRSPRSPRNPKSSERPLLFGKKRTRNPQKTQQIGKEEHKLLAIEATTPLLRGDLAEESKAKGDLFETKQYIYNRDREKPKRKKNGKGFVRDATN